MVTPITNQQITDYVQTNIGSFHEKRLEALNNLRLNKLLRRKNPYLFRSKNINTATELITSLLDAYLSSQEETLFGDFLEGLALYVAETARGGWKSTATGIDIEFEIENTRYIVSVKSGPNWANSSQIVTMKENFRNAARRVRQGNPSKNVMAVNGCCYGRTRELDKGGYFKYCGQEFWLLISGDPDLYSRIIDPLGHEAKQRNEDFSTNYKAIVDGLSSEFSERFCDQEGAIDWEKLVSFGSAKN